MKQKTITHYTQNIERDLLFEVMMSVKNGLISESQVQKLSQEFLEVIQEQTIERVLKGMKMLAGKYKEAQNVFLTYWKEYLEERRAIALKRGRIYLKNGNLEKAVVSLKGGTVHV